MASDKVGVASLPPDDEIDFAALIRKLWRGKWLIAAITGVFSIAAVFYALSLPNIYRSEALLAPVTDEGASGLSALAAQYGSLASLAGINLRRGSVDKTALGLEILKSRKFLSDFIAKHDLLVPVMAANGWNAESGALTLNSDVYDERNDEWVRNAPPPRGPRPSLQEASEKFFNDFLSVNQDTQTGFVRIAVDYYSPVLAKQWVDWLVFDLNQTVMNREVDEAQQSVDYLKQQIRATALADLQGVFYRLIEEQMKTIMLANVTSEYLLRTIDPPTVPELRISPNRAFIAIVGFLLGIVIGSVVVLTLNELRLVSSRRG